MAAVEQLEKDAFDHVKGLIKQLEFKIKMRNMKTEKVEVKPNQFVWVDKDTKIKDVRPYVGKWHLEKGVIINKFPDYLTDLSECELIVAASPELNLDGVPTNL